MYSEETVVAQLSGLESIEVILKAMERNDINVILPVISFSGIEVNIENDPWQMHFYNQLVERAAQKFSTDKKILTPINISHQNIWRALAGNTCNIQAQQFGFYSPCLSCKMYFHIVRMPLVLSTSSKVITVSEADKKPYSNISQAYTQKLMDMFGVEWINGSAEVPKEKKHISCGFSGSLKYPDGSFVQSTLIENYYDKYLYPAAESITRELIIKDALENRELLDFCRERLR